MPVNERRAREALSIAEQRFEQIRMLLVDQLLEPARSAFWTAASARDEMRNALTAFASPSSAVVSAHANTAQGEHPDKKTMTISLTEREQEALDRLMAEQELSAPQVFKCALREYQMGHERRKAGETIVWSGDDQRAREFAGPLANTAQGEGVREALPSHPRANVRPAFSDTMINLLDAYEQSVWKWAQGCEVDGIQQRSQIGDSYNESQRDDAQKARSALLRQIDALTAALAQPNQPPAGEIPKGMKPWHGGDAAPEDWDEGEVLYRNGIMGRTWDRPTRWVHAASSHLSLRDSCTWMNPASDIIAYTPKANQPPAGEGDEADGLRGDVPAGVWFGGSAFHTIEGRTLAPWSGFGRKWWRRRADFPQGKGGLPPAALQAPASGGE